MIRLARIVGIAAAGMMALSAPAAAQPIQFLEAGASPAGWTIRPSLTGGIVWDNNAYVLSTVDSPASDLVATFNPSGTIDFTGKRNTFAAGYSGAFTGYQSFSTLNSFGQSAHLSFRRQLSAHTTFAASQSSSFSPTTEVQSLVGVPFVRLGSRVADFSATIDSTISRRTTISASYSGEIVRFDQDPVLGRAFAGGHSNGGSVGVRRRFSARLSGTGDYRILWASVISGGGFSMQDAAGGMDYQITGTSHVFTNVGFSRVVTLDLSQPSLLPIWRAGYTRKLDRGAFEVTYGRDFVPSYHGGGTQQNQELTGRLRWTLGRRSYTQGSATWRRDSVLSAVDARALPLQSLWFSGTLGYRLREWAQLEAFYSGLGQHIDRPGGTVNWQRAGIQISMSAPMRFR